MQGRSECQTQTINNKYFKYIQKQIVKDLIIVAVIHRFLSDNSRL